MIIDCVSGPHLLLAAAVVKLAVRDLTDPNHSEEAQAFLRGNLMSDDYTAIDPSLLADLLGYRGSWERYAG